MSTSKTYVSVSKAKDGYKVSINGLLVDFSKEVEANSFAKHIEKSINVLVDNSITGSKNDPKLTILQKSGETYRARFGKNVKLDFDTYDERLNFLKEVTSAMKQVVNDYYQKPIAPKGKKRKVKKEKEVQKPKKVKSKKGVLKNVKTPVERSSKSKVDIEEYNRDNWSKHKSGYNVKFGIDIEVDEDGKDVKWYGIIINDDGYVGFEKKRDRNNLLHSIIMCIKDVDYKNNEIIKRLETKIKKLETKKTTKTNLKKLISKKNSNKKSKK
jgi:hypothetical protein